MSEKKNLRKHFRQPLQYRFSVCATLTIFQSLVSILTKMCYRLLTWVWHLNMCLTTYEPKQRPSQNTVYIIYILVERNLMTCEEFIWLLFVFMSFLKESILLHMPCFKIFTWIKHLFVLKLHLFLWSSPLRCCSKKKDIKHFFFIHEH